ncbi:MAG: leucine-rich repeat protein [Elusimicrobiaceae bacterium]|nr:leucine-rich repeat protein [Elusimicrobiaceae bacterium]
MTISSQICKRIYQADGENRTWEYDFPILSAANLYVYVTSPEGTEEKITTGYEVNTLQNTVTYPTLASGLDPLASGYKITLVRQSELTQDIHLTQQGTLDAAELEHGYDKLTLQVQEIAEQTQRSIKYDVSSGKTGTDAATFLAELASAQTTALTNALDSVAQTKTQLEQTVAQEQTARQNADSALQSAVDAKQNALTTAQQTAVDSGITSSIVAQVQTNKEDIAALDEELDETRPWVKPADWMDIRSGALPNSVYYLVGHSADYSTYGTFDIYATLASSGTYDVYVDGVKQVSAVASGTTTTLNWQTLALSTGFDVTYPSALRTHIVRLVPTDTTQTFTRLGTTNLNRNGLLWAHITTNYSLNLRDSFRNSSSLEVITASGNAVITSSLYNSFIACSSLVELPAFDGENGNVSLYQAFSQCGSLKRVTLKNMQASSGLYSFSQCSALQKITCDNTTVSCNNNTFDRCPMLKALPPLETSSTTTGAAFLTGDVSLDNTFLDMQDATGLTKFVIGGASSARIDGLKGFLVSNSAPFSGSSPQINVSYTGLDKGALVNLFNSFPTVTDSQVCNVTGCTGANDLTAEDLAIATGKGWTITR